jgi:uncharacterized damage-inducible protein DinB
MITPGYISAMAEYNRWQNENLYGAADQLTDAARKAPRGAWFGSIHGTLNHLLWARPDLDEPLRRHPEAQSAEHPGVGRHVRELGRAQARADCVRPGDR